ncbi:MAG TPA: hypothetical protein VGC08_15710 [Pedobacter sp.]
MPVQTEQTLFAERGFFKGTSGETFSASYVIHAYEQGIEKGKCDKTAELTAEARSLFLKNRNYMVGKVFDLIEEMIADGLDMKRGWIRSEGTNEFDVIIAVPELNYHSTDFDKFHIKVNDLEVLSNSPDFHLKIRFINNDRPIKEELIFNDGYNLKLDVQLFQKS